MAIAQPGGDSPGGGFSTVMVGADPPANAPQVSKVLVSSSSWSPAFLDALGDVGFAIPAGSDQLDVLPWANIDRISMVFSENVNLSQGDLAVYGQNVPQYAIAGFNYNSSTLTATWALSRAVDEGDVLRLVLSDAVVDGVGNMLDGEWADTTSAYPSGNGSSGGAFQMQIRVLPGDADGNGRVGWNDLMVLTAQYSGAAYGLTADFNGDGVVDAGDYIALKLNFGNVASPVSMVMAASGTGSVSARIHDGSDVDVFKFDATASGDMTVSMAKDISSDLIGSVNARDSCGAQLAVGEAGDGTAWITFHVVAGQTYYLHAASVSQTVGGYVLTAATQADPAPDPAPGVSVVGTIQLSGGTMRLVVSGTNGNDVITLAYDGSATSLVSGAGTQMFAGYCGDISVYGFGGDDVIRLDYSIMGISLVYAGDGNDKVYENSQGAATIYGEAGDDLLIAVGGGNDVVYGGSGADSFWVDTADTLADVDSAETSAKAVHRIAGFYQPYSTDPASVDYISREIDSQSLRDPTTTYPLTNYANWALFVDGPQYDDIRQGSLNDCYYLAVLAGLADTDPNLIRQAITELGDGTYAVRFYRGGLEVYLRMDADMPSAYAKLTPDNETWVMLMEKAYAFFRYGQNSYASMESGWMNTVVTELTNAATQSLWTGASLSVLADSISTNLATGHSMTLGSYSTAASPIIGSHAYMIKSIEGAGADAYVTVYNPWGYDGRTYDSNPADGLLRLSMTQLQQCFSGIVIALV